MYTATGTSGYWSSTNTWALGLIPTKADDVIVTAGFTLYVDSGNAGDPTVQGFQALSVTLYNDASLVFKPQVAGSSLTVTNNIVFNDNASLKLNSTKANDVIYLNVKGMLDMYYINRAAVEINASHLGTQYNVNAGNIRLGGYFLPGSLSNFTANVTARPSSFTIICQDVTAGMDSSFNLIVSTNNSNIILQLGNTSANGNLDIKSQGNCLIRNTGQNNIINVRTNNVTINADGTYPIGGNFTIENTILNSTIVYNLNGYLKSWGTVKFQGANPSNNPKPDPENQRNIIVIGNPTNSYMLLNPLFNTCSAIFEHVHLNSIGKFRSVNQYGICLIGESNAIDGSAWKKFVVYNCDISSSVDTGIYLKNCQKVNTDWFGQGITSSVVRGCGINGIWFDSAKKCGIKGNKIYKNPAQGTNNGYGIHFTNNVFETFISEQNTIENNDIYSNMIMGIYFEGASKNLIWNNKVHDQNSSNGQEGIYLYNSVKNIITWNECYNNPVHGIALEYGSNNNYIANNNCYGNQNGGMRVRYNANTNIFVDNTSSSNARTGFTSHSSINNTLISEIYHNNNLYGDIFVEGEANEGYVSQIWLKDCLLQSPTEFANTPEKQEFTKTGSWVISQKHKRTQGLTRIWGQFSMPQSAHTWHTPNSLLNWNYLDPLFTGKSHGWNTTVSQYDTPMLRYDDGGTDGAGFPPLGTNDITSITTSSTTLTELWIVTYDANSNRWTVWGSSSGWQSRPVIPDTDYESDNTRIKFRITHNASPISPGEQYVFITVANSNDSNIQKKVELSDFSDPNYIGASFSNNSGATVKIIGVSTAPTVITRKLAEDKPASTPFYYGITLGGTIDTVKYASFTYINADGLILNSKLNNNASNIYFGNLQTNTTYSTVFTANNVNTTYTGGEQDGIFDNVVIDTTTAVGVFNITGNNSTLYFRDYKRPFLADKLISSQVYWDPTLTWSGLTGFETSGVSPVSSERMIAHEFQVKYFDRGLVTGGNAPTAIQAWIDVNDNGFYEAPNEKLNLQIKSGAPGNDGNYTNGETYYLYPSTAIDYAGDGYLKYRFFASNSNSFTYSTYTFNIDSASNSVLGINEACGDNITGYAIVTSTFGIKGTPPRVTVQTPSGTNLGGQIPVIYSLIDSDNKSAPHNYCSIKVEFSKDSISWSTATVGSGSEDLINLSASLSPGTTHVFVWNSSIDLPEQESSAKIRITPTDEDGTGTITESSVFLVDNVGVSKLKITSVSQQLDAGTTSQLVTVLAQSPSGVKDLDAVLTLKIESNSTNYSLIYSTFDPSIFYTTTMTASVLISSSANPGYLNMVGGEISFRYIDFNPGSPNILVSETPSVGLQDDNQTWTITRRMDINTSTVTITAGTYQAGVDTVTVYVTLRDSNSSPVSGKSVQLYATGSNNYLTQPTLPTGVDGVTIGYFRSNTAELKTISAINVTDSLSIKSSATFVLSAGPVDTSISTFTVSQSRYILLGTTIYIDVFAKDKYSNPIPNKTVTISVTNQSGSDTLAQPSGNTDANGLAEGRFIGNTVGSKIISATVDGLTLISTVTVHYVTGDAIPPTLISINPADGSNFSSPVNEITVILTDEGNSGLNLSSTTINIVRPSGSTVIANKTVVSSITTGSFISTATLSFSFTPEGITGVYTINLFAHDNTNNVSTTTSRFEIASYAGPVGTDARAVAGRWNDPNTWNSLRVPNTVNDVTLDKGFTLYVDSIAPCTAASLLLKDGAKVIFQPGNPVMDITGALSLSNDCEIQIITESSKSSYTINCGDLMLTGNFSTFKIYAANENTTVNLNIKNLVMNPLASAIFEIVSSTNNTNMNIVSKNLNLGSGNKFSINISGDNTNLSLLSSGPGVDGKLSVGVNSDFTVVNNSTGTNLNLNFDDIEILNGTPSPGLVYIRNNVLSSTMTVNLAAAIVNNGLMYLWGKDPGGAPSPAGVFRNLKIVGNPTWSYIQSYNVIDCRNVDFSYFGIFHSIDKYGIGIFGCNGSDRGVFLAEGGKRVYFYNCNIHDSPDTGLYFKNNDRLNRDWYDQGITSCVIHNNGYNGVWFDSTKHSTIRNSVIYNNIGGNVGYGIHLNNASNENEMSNNNVYGNKIRGIFLENSNKNLIDTNKAHDQLSEEGISLIGSEKNTIVNNLCYSNPVHGLALETNSKNNYIASNHFYLNANGGARVRYNSDGNIFVANFSTNNVRTGFASHSSKDTLCVDETYTDNNNYGDIYIEGEANQGYVSQIWLKNCLLQSPTEFVNTPEKQEFSKDASWVISQKHKTINGVTRIWGQFSMPQSAHTWHTQDITKWNQGDQLYSGRAHGWNTSVNTFDTPMLRYDDGGLDGSGGSNDITSITTSSTTKSELWIISYSSIGVSNAWQVRGSRSGIQKKSLMPDTDYTSDNNEIGLRLTHRQSPISPAEQYVFVTIENSNDINIQKKVELADFSDPNYIGASFTNNSGATVEIIGVSSAPTIITHKLAEDKPAGTTFYYAINLGGTINSIKYASFTYINANGLTLNSKSNKNVSNIYFGRLQSNTTYSAVITANNINTTYTGGDGDGVFDNIVIDTATAVGVYNVVAANSLLYFRDFKRPFLPDKLIASQVFWDPTLTWSGLTGFETSGVSPVSSDRLIAHEFQIKYFDRGLATGGNAPTTIQVWIDVNDNGFYEANEKLNLQPKPGVSGNEGNYSNGETYYLYPSTAIDYIGDGYFKYRFVAINNNSFSYSSYTFNMDSTSNSVIGINEASGDYLTGYAVVTSTFSVKGTPPRATVTTPFIAPPAKLGGIIPVTYQLIDEDNKSIPNNLCSISVQFSRDGITWSPATKGLGSENTTALESSLSPGTTHIFAWDTITDLSEQETPVTLRITPTDEDGTGQPANTSNFTVDNIRVSKIRLTAAEQELLSGVTSQIIKVEALSASGILDTDANLTIKMQSTSTDYMLITSSDTSISIGSGTALMDRGILQFKYFDRVKGSPTLMVIPEPSQGIASDQITFGVGRPVSAITSSITVLGVSPFTVGTSTTTNAVTVIVTLRDTAGSPVKNKLVRVDVSPPDQKITVYQPTIGTTDNGEAVARILSTVAGTRIITATDISDSPNILLVSTEIITFKEVWPGTSTISTIISNESVKSVGSTVTITVTIKDIYGNGVPNQTASLSVNSSYAISPDTITSSAALTDTNGIIAFNFCGNTIGNKYIEASVGGGLFKLMQGVTVYFDTLASLDKSSPVVVSVSPSSNTVLAYDVTSVSATISDMGIAFLNFNASTITVTDANGAFISGVISSATVSITTYSSVNNLILTFTSPIKTNGSYKINVKPVDNGGNSGDLFVSSFTIRILTAEEVFKGSVYTYPNPSKTGVVKFNYTLLNTADVTIRIYDIMGELIFEDTIFSMPAGTNNIYPWNSVNQTGNSVASGVYIAKIIAQETSNKSNRYTTTKKQIVIKTK